MKDFVFEITDPPLFDFEMEPNELLDEIQKHLAGQHDQSSHGSWSSGESFPMAGAFADAWIGGTEKYPYGNTDLVRSAYRVLTNPNDNYYPKTDENGRVPKGFDYKEIFDSTKELLSALSSAKPSDTTMYRGLAFGQFDKMYIEKLLTVGNTFKEDLASWTPNLDLAQTFSQDHWGKQAETSIVMKIDGLKSISLVPHTSNKSKEVVDGAEVISSGRYTVTKVKKINNNSFEIDVRQDSLPYDPTIVKLKNFDPNTGSVSMG